MMVRVWWRCWAVAWLGWAMACAKTGEGIRVGADEDLKESGLVAYLQSAYEASSNERVQLRYFPAKDLQAAVRAGQVDYAVFSAAVAVRGLEDEGLAIERQVVAQDALVLIGPADEDPLGARKNADPVNLLRHISRSNYKFMRPKVGSAALMQHEAWVRAMREQEPGHFLRTDALGVELVRRAVRANALAWVRRSSLVLAAGDGIRPHKVYRPGDEEALALAVVAVRVHPGKTGRKPSLGFGRFLGAPDTPARVAALGVERFGLPLFSVQKK